MQLDPIELYFRKTGQGPDLIILHGLFGSSDNWISVAKQLEENYTIWLIDQRNHGRSEHTPDWSYELMAADLKHFIESHNINRPAILGHSMGGKTLMHFSLNNPKTARCQIIVDIAPKQYPNHHQNVLDGLQSIDLITLNDRKNADIKLSNYIKEIDVRQFLLKNLYRNEDENYGWRINLSVISENIEQIGRSQNSNIPCHTPTLFLRGALSDYIILPNDSILINQLFPNFSIETVERAGHWLHAQKPIEFTEKLSAFLELHQS